MTKIVTLRKQPASRWKALDKLTADADWLVERRKELHQRPTLDEYDETVLARCHEALALLDPDENYEDGDREDGLRRDVVALRLAGLIGAFPNGCPSDPEVYSAMLLESVSSTIDGLGLLALDAAVRQLVTTQKFLPAVSEVLEVVREQDEKWHDRRYAIRSIVADSRRIMAKKSPAYAVESARRELIIAEAWARKSAQDVAEAEEKLRAALQAEPEAKPRVAACRASASVKRSKPT